MNPLKGFTMGALREKTKNTTQRIKDKGYHVVEKGEHEFQQEKKKNPDLQSFLLCHNLQDRLNPRDAFFGGRTNTIKLYCEGNIKYVDFTSLYPWVSLFFLYLFCQ